MIGLTVVLSSSCHVVFLVFIAVDFYNELSLIWGIIVDIGIAPMAAGQGFPPGFEYRWSGGNSNRTATPCCGAQYVEHVMHWVDTEINNTSLFPTSAAAAFPKTFINSIKVIYTRLFRIFAIIYCHHFLQLEELGAVSHLNTSFKHFLFFCWEFDLVTPMEQEALQDIIHEIKLRYESLYDAYDSKSDIPVDFDLNNLNRDPYRK
mmetsp:Transcript_761/g.1321  ORF Transcript_761/g.1321 Transcript_761/m.1321 type:complete len:205 (-) Transcript_761:306-920(-)